MMHKTFLGFDIRLHGVDYIDKWGKERREIFLLNPKAKWPLSVDPSVWPSVFDYLDMQVPYDVNNILYERVGLWKNIEKMQSFFNLKKQNKGRSGRVVCVELVTEKPLSLLEHDNVNPGFTWSDFLSPEEMLPLESIIDWEFLGYDVADGWKTSGLSNCSYYEEELKQLRPKWSSRINEHGLIKSLEDAMKFKTMTDKRVHEHAPFFVYGLYWKSNNLLSG